MYIANTLIPIFLIVLLGYILRRTGFVTESFFKESNKLVYWVGLPCLLFIKTSKITLQEGPAFRMSMILVLVMVVCIIIAYTFGWLFKIPLGGLGSFVQAAFRGNIVYIGLPVVLFALNSGLTPQLEALAVLVIAPITIIYNVASVLVLLLGNPHKGNSGNRKKIQTLLMNIFTNPLFLAVVLGIGYSYLDLTIPSFASRSLSTVGQISLPMALLGIGATLKPAELKDRLWLTFSGSIIKVLVAPLVGFLIARAWNLSPVEVKITLLYLACPTAVASFVMAEQLMGDHVLTSNIIILSTLMSFPMLALVLVIT